MKKLMCGVFVVVVVCIQGISPQASAGIPRMMNYQGKLTGADGKLVADGSYEMTFSLYDAASGGAQEWTETWDSGTSPVQLTNGLFNVLLGSHSSLTVDFGENYWLEQQVKYGGSYETLLPRQQVASVGYAMRAEKVTDGAITDASISPSAAIADTKLATISTAGKVSGSAVSGGTLGAVNGSAITDLNGGNISSGNLGVARLPSGGNWGLTSDLGITGSNVGIGTTSPGKLLTIASPASSGITQNLFLQNNDNTPSTWAGASIQFGAADTVDNYSSQIIGYSNTYNEYGSRLLLRTHSNTSGVWNTGVMINENGNVGIGMVTPQVRVDVIGMSSIDGDARILGRFHDTTGFAAGVGGGLAFTGKFNSAGTLGTFAGIKGVKTNSTDGDYSGDLVFWTITSSSSPVEKMRILNNGNVGIGTTNPGAYKLNIAGTGYLGASAWAYSSDIRLKENISDIQSGLDIIEHLRPVKFDYINGDKKQTGFIAQEVWDVLPDIVTEGPDGMLGMKTDSIIPYLVKAVKEQQREIEALKARLNIGQ